MGVKVKTNVRLTAEANLLRSLTWELEIERRIKIAVHVAKSVRAQALAKIGAKKIKKITIVRYAPRTVKEENIQKSLEVIKMTLEHLLKIDEHTKYEIRQETGVGTQFGTVIDIDFDDRLSA